MAEAREGREENSPLWALLLLDSRGVELIESQNPALSYFGAMWPVANISPGSERPVVHKEFSPPTQRCGSKIVSQVKLFLP